MAKKHAKTGQLRFTPTITALTIALNDNGASPDTITDSGNGLITAGFKVGDLITVSGTPANDGNYTLTVVTAGTLTMAAGSLSATEGAGANVTVFTAMGGQIIAGFFGWSVSDGVDVVEVTDFVDGAAGFKKYIAGLEDWTAEAQGFWLTNDFHTFMIGQELTVDFFQVYDDDPTGTTVHLLRGKAIVGGIDVDTNVNDVIHENLTFQGTGSADIQGTGIAFNDNGGSPDTITDTGNGFIRAGFVVGHKITVSGSTSSDGTYTITAVVEGTISIATGSFAGNEAAGDVVTISAGIQLAPITTAWPT